MIAEQLHLLSCRVKSPNLKRSAKFRCALRLVRASVYRHAYRTRLSILSMADWSNATQGVLVRSISHSSKLKVALCDTAVTLCTTRTAIPAEPVTEGFYNFLTNPIVFDA